MKRAILSLAAVPLLAGCMLPEGVTEEDLMKFDTAVASIGCELSTESHYLPVELQTGMTREKLIEIAQYKVQREQAVPLPSGGVRSVVGACAPTAAPAPAPEA
ncbi:hypothetical protein ACN2XU_03780 [Primorskyibacter sp. 2E107]|uniref:hypothetical protein n=1 Tax=Primorskyibacter sp. 2E107 TaxID=3403458 RepID=UPI003AF8936C